MLVLDGESCSSSVAFAGDGMQLVAAGPSAVAVWALPGGEPLYHLGPFYPVPLVQTVAHIEAAVPESGRFLFVTAEQPLAAHSLSDGRPVSTVPGTAVWKVIASRDGSWVVAVEAGEQARLFGYHCTSNGELHRAWGVGSERYEIPWAFLGAGERFVTNGGRGIVVRDALTAQIQYLVACPARPIECAAAVPDGSRFAVGSSMLYIWDTATWGEPAGFRAGRGYFISLAFHPTRPVIAAIQYGQTLVKFLDINTGKVLTKFQWKLGEMRSVCFSPDGTLAAAGSASGKIVVWDVD